ncbi:MAG TPA: AMP-binding protein [Pontiella sp.]
MTIKTCLNSVADESPTAIALKYKKEGVWRTISFGELRERAWHVSEILAGLGVKAGDRVAIFRENSPEWFEIYHGIIGLGAIAVPVDAKLREQEVGYIFHDCGVKAVFCSAPLSEMMAELSARLSDLESVVVLDSGIDDIPESDDAEFYSYEYLWADASETAKSDARAFDRATLDSSSIASLIYTSGTTGRPKGATLTHDNFLVNVSGIEKAIDVHSTDNFMLVLPLHHSFAFTCMLVLPVHARCQVSIVHSLRTIAADMAATSPTVLLAVPLLLEKMLSRVMVGIEENKPAKFMYRFGLGKLVGRRVKQGLGGALRLVVSGAAPISPSTLRAWSRLGIPIVEGYGITETAPVLCVNPLHAPRIGTVGLPIDDVQLKIHEPREDGTGEILARGPNVMQGYYNNPEATAKVLVDGWYHTGDLGYFDEKGYLVINGRKKSLIVNREGKNIYPEEIERQVMESKYVLECLALGYREPNDGVGERVGLIVVPDLEVFDALEDVEGRLSDDGIETRVRNDVREKLMALSDYKRPRRIEIRFNAFERTTTQKIKRYLYAINTGGCKAPEEV